jgi:hypothetical protein
MNRAETELKVAHYVSEMSSSSGVVLVLFDDATLERDFGWVFFYGSPHDELLAGNGPFIVDSRDGSVHVTGTAHRVEEYLEAYARYRRKTRS